MMMSLCLWTCLLCYLKNNTFLLFMFFLRWSHEIATGGSGSLRKKNNAWKQCSSSLGERVVGASFPEQFKCMSCSLNRLRSRYSIKGSTPTIPRAFVDKSAFNLSGHSLDTASVSKLLPHRLLMTICPILRHQNVLFFSSSWMKKAVLKGGADITTTRKIKRLIAWKNKAR